MSILSPKSMKAVFDSAGYLVIPSFLNPLQIDEVQRKMDEYVRDVVPHVPVKQVFYENKDRPETLKQL